MQTVIIIGIIIVIILLIILIYLQFNKKDQSVEKALNILKENNQVQDIKSEERNQQVIQALIQIQNNLRSNENNLVENNTRSDQLNRVIKQLLSETINTRESLGMSDVKLNKLVSDIQDMNNIMVNTKRRGNFGEYSLYNILDNYLGNSYEKQYTLSNHKIGDAALLIPGSEKVMIIDSKFPQENYLRIIKEESHESILEFKRNVKKHIDDITNKYINEETTPQAIMYIPSESIYLYICEEHSDLIDYANNKHVLMTSPTTLMGVCMTLLQLTKDYRRSENLENVEKEIIALKKDIDRLVERNEKIQRTLNTLDKQYTDMTISVNKVAKRVTNAYEGSIEE